jgi:hypothetical protein
MTQTAVMTCNSLSAVSLDGLVNKLREMKHTGQVVLHFAEGRPTRAEIPATPTRIALTKTG